MHFPGLMIPELCLGIPAAAAEGALAILSNDICGRLREEGFHSPGDRSLGVAAAWRAGAQEGPFQGTFALG